VVPHWTSIDWGPSVKNVLVDDLRVRYLDYGSGPVLALLHGMAASWQWWLENIPTLAQHHRIIAVDLPGCGNSEALPAPAEMSDYARVVLGLLSRLGIESATVAGHSMGGLVALQIAAADPQRVRELILVDAGGVPMTARRLATLLVLLRMSGAVLRRPSVRRAMVGKSWVRRVAFATGFRNPTAALSPELAAEIVPVFGGPGFIDSVSASGRAVRATVPESIACPVLLIWGEHDIMAPLRCAQDMQNVLPDSELVMIGGAGHTPMIEFPDQFNAAVLAFTAARR
jgi:pimeloyl-ACP methyl ester carboxylesterase